MNKDAVILFRKGIAEEGEFEAAKRHFNVVERRTNCSNAYVIPRYSALPYYLELEDDLANRGCQMINSYAQHKYIANFEYYYDVVKYTPKTWFSLAAALSDGYQGPFFIKGTTNSRKYEWRTHCFAENTKEAIEVSSRLYQDGLIGGQNLIYREFVPLKVLEYGINGLPFANEYRFFFYYGQPIAHGFYWSCADEFNIPKYMNPLLLDLAFKVSDIVKSHVNGYVIDVAEKENGEPILIELNDLSQSGLSTIDPNQFYRRLKEVLNESYN